MKIIFLDIDSVLCTRRAHFAYGEGYMMSKFDTVAAEMIKKLCDKDTKIVVSSTWRHNEKNCKKALKDVDLKKLLHTDWKTIRSDRNLHSVQKGAEIIKEWLDRHPETNKYIIIDDDYDFLPNQIPYHIHTDTLNGMSFENYMQAKKLLNTKATPLKLLLN